MRLEKTISNLLKLGNFSNDEIIEMLLNGFDSLNEDEYNSLMELAKGDGDISEDLLYKIYSKVDDEIRFKMWKNTNIDSCPVGKLLDMMMDKDIETSNTLSKSYVFSMPSTKAYFSDIQEIVIKEILKAKDSLEIAMAWFTNPEIFKVLLRICKRGDTEVTLIINNDLINNRLDGLPFNQLIENGAELHVANCPELIHNKFCIIDNTTVIDGSYNWTILAEKNNDENIVVLSHCDAVTDFVRAFRELTRKYPKVDEMPDRVPEKLEYDACSYKNYNTEELLHLADATNVVRKKKNYYKQIFKLLPEDLAKERIPSSYYDEVKDEITEEKEHDRNLFVNDLEFKQKQLNEEKNATKKALEVKQKAIEHEKSVLEAKRAKSQKEIKRLESCHMDTRQRQEKISKQKTLLQSEEHKIKANIRSYLKEERQLKLKVSAIDSKLEYVAFLKTTELKGSNGLCRVNLQWRSGDDLDLHLLLPNGKDVYYSEMKGSFNGTKCELDYDANAGCSHIEEAPQENIIMTEHLADGKYKINVVLFKQYDNSIPIKIPFSLSVISGNYIKTESLTFTKKEGETMFITELIIRNGKLVTPVSINQ